jgi:phosphate transport system protein
MNTPRHFDLEISELKRSIVAMGDLALQSVALAVESINAPRVAVREEAKVIEQTLDEMHSQIEERGHQIIALHSPVAGDLRFLISSLRIISDLEQIGDLGESVCKRAAYIARHQSVPNPPDLAQLGALARNMVQQSIEAFVTHDLTRARAVFDEEPITDRLTKQCYKSIQQGMAETPGRIQEYTHLLRGVGHLEHIGDIAVSVAEEAVYVHDGRLLRHHREDLKV